MVITDPAPTTLSLSILIGATNEEFDPIKTLSEIFVFKHSEYNKAIKLIPSSERQQKKGLMQVIDKEDFRRNNPELIFDNIDSFKNYAEINLKKIDTSWA